MTRLTRKSEAQANAEALARRSSVYADESAASVRVTSDRVRYRPQGKRALLRWAQRQAQMDGPLRLHGRGIADDGAPRMTGEAIRYLGMASDDEPTDWVSVACQRDEDGDYIAPVRCAIARIGVRRPRSARILRGIVAEFSNPTAVVAGDVHPEFADDVVVAALNRLYDAYTVHPVPTKAREGLAS